MLFLKNLLLRNFQGCCLLFNYQGSSLFLLIRSSFNILSHRFSFVKNFFIFLFAVCFGFFLPHKSAYLGYHIRILLSRTFFTLSSDLLSHPVPSRPCGFRSLLRSVSATCAILSLCRWIVNDFFIFYLIQTIQTIHLCFWVRDWFLYLFTKGLSHHWYFLPPVVWSLWFLLPYPDILWEGYRSQIPVF